MGGTEGANRAFHEAVGDLIGSAARYGYTGDPQDILAASFFWDRVVQHHSYATGGHGLAEYWGPPDQLSARVDGRTAETCNVYNMIKLTRRLFSIRPDAFYVDFQERALFNHILGSIDPADGAMCYMVPVGQGVSREYQNMTRSFTCCVGSGMESHALHGDGQRIRRRLTFGGITGLRKQLEVRLDLCVGGQPRGDGAVPPLEAVLEGVARRRRCAPGDEAVEVAGRAVERADRRDGGGDVLRGREIDDDRQRAELVRVKVRQLDVEREDVAVVEALPGQRVIGRVELHRVRGVGLWIPVARDLDRRHRRRHAHIVHDSRVLSPRSGPAERLVRRRFQLPGNQPTR